MLKIYQLWEESVQKVAETSDPYYLGRTTALHECLGILIEQQKEEDENDSDSSYI